MCNRPLQPRILQGQSCQTFRTTTCGKLEQSLTGKSIDVSAWVHSVRVMGDGLAFITLRDAYGQVQVVVEVPPPRARQQWEQQLIAAATGLKPECVVHVTGVVKRRPAERVNHRQINGEIEISAEGLRVLSTPAKALPVLPSAAPASEETRLTYRYLDLRRDVLQRNLRLRSLLSYAIRTYLITGTSPPFIEVETPTLVRSSPEGAREFLVPTRQPGKFYALAQSPQQFKQMLMIGGVDRYFQLARCYRDEAGRADRQPEFTQVDMEMSFAQSVDVQDVVEGMLRHTMTVARDASRGASANFGTASFNHLSPPLLEWQVPSSPFPRLSYLHCMCVYGSDKPERRVGMPLMDISAMASSWDSEAPALAGMKKVLQDIQSTAATAEGRHPRFCTAGVPWSPDVFDSDLSPLQPTSPALRVFVAPGLGDALSRAEGDAVQAEILKAIGRGTGTVLCRVSSSGLLKDSILAKGLTPQQQALLVSSTGAKTGDALGVVWGHSTAGAHAAGIARLAVADVMRHVGLVQRFHPHGTAVRFVPGDVLSHALGSTLSGILHKHAKENTKVTALPPQGSEPALDLFWVTGFPLFERDPSTGVLSSSHHPFTAPVAEDAPALTVAAAKGDTDTLLTLRGQHYDLVANGVELGGGSVRIHDAGVQRAVLEQVLQLRPAEQHGFGTLLAALDAGAPPHAGIALGLDRLVSMLAGPAGASSVRDVIAFPKSATGSDLLTGAPAEATEEQLKEYHIAAVHRSR